MKDYKIKISVEDTPKGITVAVNLKQNKLLGNKPIPTDVQLAIKTALDKSLEKGIEDGKTHMEEMSMDDLKKENKTTKNKAGSPNSKFWEDRNKFLEEQAKQCTNGDAIKPQNFTSPYLYDVLTDTDRKKIYEILLPAVNRLLHQTLESMSHDQNVAEQKYKPQPNNIPQQSEANDHSKCNNH